MTEWINRFDWEHDNFGLNSFFILTIKHEIIEIEYEKLISYDLKNIKYVYISAMYWFHVWFNIDELVNQNILKTLTVEEKLSTYDKTITFYIDKARSGTIIARDDMAFGIDFHCSYESLDELFSGKYSYISIAELIVDSYSLPIEDDWFNCKHISAYIDDVIIKESY